jgi:hypothetical protein
MAGPAYRLPLRLRRSAGAFVIRDADGKNLAYVYFEEKAERRRILNLPTTGDAKTIARAIARALTDEATAAPPV